MRYIYSYFLLLPLLGQSVFAQSQLNIEITQGSILKNKDAKDNVFALFDDSASIQKDVVYVSEHFYGYGSPECEKPADWSAIKSSAKYRDGNYYDPFSSGNYIPYDPLNKHKNYQGTIYIEKCQKINRGVAFGGLLKQFILYFNQGYLLGFGSTGKDYSAALALNPDPNKKYSVILNPVDDLSQYTNKQWSELNEKITNTFNVEQMKNAWSPIFPALYNVSLYFRGHPVPMTIEHTTTGYKYQEYKTPLKYRCAANKIVLFTDGRPNRSYVDVFASNDTASLPSSLQSKLIFAESKAWNNGKLVILKSYPSLKATSLSNFFQNPNTQFAYIEDGYTGSEDGLVYEDSKLDRNRYKNATHPVSQNVFQGWMKQDLLAGHNVNNRPSMDLGGKSWTDNLSVPQTLSVNAVFFGKNPTVPLKNLITATDGKHITKQNLDVNSVLEDVSSILSSDGQDRFTNGMPIEDQYMRTPNTIRYVFTYNLASNSGNIHAYTMNRQGTAWQDQPVWNMNQRSYPLNGRFLTMSYKSPLNPVSEQLSVESLNKIYKERYQTDLSDAYLLWLEGISVFANTGSTTQTQFKPRHSIIGPIVNSEPAFLAKDREYINLNFFSEALKREFTQYVMAKANQMDNELLVVNANDGMVHFIKTDRKHNLSLENGGVRSAAYFPGFLAARLQEIVNLDQPFTFTMDGAANIFEFKGKNGNIKAVGLSGMGGGGKALVGYQLLHLKGNKLDTTIQPLFEIVNEDNFKYQTQGFQNLGYTYSGFAFFNRSLNGSKNAGQGVAVFGNGIGAQKSILYFIDVETGELLKQVTLSDNGGGASTPALSLMKDESTGFQQLKYVVVGDQSGRLYRVDFSQNGALGSASTPVVIYDPNAQGHRFFDHPITTKPFLYMNQELEQEWVYFGTGRKVSKDLDRGTLSKRQQYFIAAPVHNPISLSSIKEIKFRISSNIVSLNSNSQKPNQGWFLKLSTGNKDLGNRLVYQPGMTKNGDIVFSTWGITEGDDLDSCSADTGSGLQIALNAETGEIGSFNHRGTNVAGVYDALTAPTLPSGSSITYQGYLGGQMDHGSMSTLDLSDIDELNKKNLNTSHGLEQDHLSECLATTNGEVDREISEFCHNFTPRVLIKKRLSIQQLF
ncbi:PilC/PilY family type IV pilus protein [Wohlfahrtiimonas larvae]|uniref:PilY1 beta-propeller domain-containing protein n=1 Tax=Wohlfahrtiimonas larvae TaxID=1157986 RepID=A0ABP9MRY7_9GAMM|nr:PilC/PilY family type IV pilus protein [Wohlfahrtiimonas larvae]